MFQTIDSPTLAAKRALIVCPDYDPVPGEVKCQRYTKNGACTLSKHIMCVEWLRKHDPGAARRELLQLGVSLPQDLVETGTKTSLCPVCGKPQQQSPTGVVCADGHGGVDPLPPGQAHNGRLDVPQDDDPYGELDDPAPPMVNPTAATTPSK